MSPYEGLILIFIGVAWLLFGFLGFITVLFGPIGFFSVLTAYCLCMIAYGSYCVLKNGSSL